MRKSICVLSLLVMPITVNAMQPAQLICREAQGGWCESGSGCFANTLPPAEFRLAGLIPDERGTQAASLTECRDTCGDTWKAEFTRGLGNQLRVRRDGEELVIDLGTGFFSYARLSSAQTEGRVAYAFGRCEQVEGL